MMIAESLAKLVRPTAELRPHPDNPRRGNIEAIADSLRRFGQVRPILVSRDGTIIAGNHTFLAATEILGWTEIAAVTFLGDETEARAYMLADNRMADFATYDEAALSAILADLAEQGKLDATGWTPDDLDDLLAQLDAIGRTDAEEFRGQYAESDVELAAREAARAAGRTMAEIVLMFTPEDAQRFGGWVRLLKARYGTSGSIETVYEAVRREAERAGAEDAGGGGVPARGRLDAPVT